MSKLLEAVLGSAWSIQPEKLSVVVEVVRQHEKGIKISEEQREAVRERKRQIRKVNGEVAVLPLFGVIAPRANMVTDFSGGTSSEQFGASFEQAFNDPSVSAIVMDMDSPGGASAGLSELFTKIVGFRGRGKSIVAVANHTMASGAFHIAAAADQIVATPSAEVGSVGVIGMHEDFSAAREEAGVKTNIIRSSRFKADINPFEPLSEHARQSLQDRVNEFHEMFVSDLAKGRGIPKSRVEKDFGEGRVFGAEEAKTRGMIDQIDTLEGVIGRLLGTSKRSGGPRSEYDPKTDPDWLRRRNRIRGRKFA